MASLLFGISATDPVTFIGISLVVLEVRLDFVDDSHVRWVSEQLSPE